MIFFSHSDRYYHLPKHWPHLLNHPVLNVLKLCVTRGSTALFGKGLEPQCARHWFRFVACLGCDRGQKWLWKQQVLPKRRQLKLRDVTCQKAVHSCACFSHCSFSVPPRPCVKSVYRFSQLSWPSGSAPVFSTRTKLRPLPELVS